MAKPAIDIFADQAEWMKDRLVYGTTAYIADRLDSLPMPGMGLAFVRRSAESALMDRMEERLMPRLDDHLDTQLAFTRDLVDGDRDAVVDRYREDLLATDPLWDLLDGSEEVRAAARDDIIAANVTACTTAAGWVVEAGDREFAGYPAMVHHLGLTAEEAAQELNDILYYVELVGEYREHLDASDYSSVLDSEQVHDWFVERFIDGLRVSEEEILAEIRDEVASHTA